MTKRKVLRPKGHSVQARFLIALLCFLTNLCVNAQTGRHFDADKQMSSSFTTQIYQDHDGFIWVATRNGLNRYDGYQFRIIKKEKPGNSGMASNYVNCMMQDRHGLFYIGMFGAFQTYDGEHFQDIKVVDLRGITHSGYITCLLERKNGDIIVGTSGHGLLKMTDAHTAKQIGGALKHLNTINCLIEDSKQRLWIGSESHGLLCYDRKNIKSYFVDKDATGNVLDVCEDHQGHIFIATANSGLFRMDGETPVHIDATGNKHISTLYVCKDGRIILGYDGMGMARTIMATSGWDYSKKVSRCTLLKPRDLATWVTN